MDEKLEQLFSELDSLLDVLCVHGADKAQEARQKLAELELAVIRKMAARPVHREES